VLPDVFHECSRKLGGTRFHINRDGVLSEWPIKKGERKASRQSVLFPHRDFAARRAMDFRRALLNFLARAFPPLSPPSRPRATAAGFLPLSSGVGTVGVLGRSVMASISVRWAV
jgi:hypothetical protein